MTKFLNRSRCSGLCTTPACGTSLSLANDDRALLAEAAAWRDGPNGVGSLATDHGAENPELFVDWVDALIGAGRSDDATDACAQALATMPALGEPRAQIAERLTTVSTAAADSLCGRMRGSLTLSGR